MINPPPPHHHPYCLQNVKLETQSQGCQSSSAKTHDAPGLQSERFGVGMLVKAMNRGLGTRAATSPQGKGGRGVRFLIDYEGACSIAHRAVLPVPALAGLGVVQERELHVHASLLQLSHSLQWNRRCRGMYGERENKQQGEQGERARRNERREREQKRQGEEWIEKHTQGKTPRRTTHNERQGESESEHVRERDKRGERQTQSETKGHNFIE